jgi:hypothetical protein
LFFVTEIEAKEACKWLRAAGFPQYAQMYEGEYYYYVTVAVEIRFSKLFMTFFIIFTRFAISHRRERRAKGPSFSRPRLFAIVVQKTARLKPLRKHEIRFCAKTRSEYTTFTLFIIFFFWFY